MTTLKELTELVKKDDEIIIKNQEKSNDHLESLDKNFSKFFDQQERARLDDLEDRLERKRAIKPTARGAGGAAAAGGLGFGTGVGVGAALKQLLSLLTSPKALALAAAALFGKGALRLGKESFNSLRNALDDRAKTNRGLLRFEAEELKRYEQARKVQLEADRIKAMNLANEKKRQAKELIRNAENDQRLKDEARVRAAEAEAERIKARVLKQQIQASTETIRVLKNTKRLGTTKQLSDTLDEIRATIDTSIDIQKTPTRVSAPTVETISNAIGDTARAPTVGPTVYTDTTPSKMTAPDGGQLTTYQQLKAFSDAELGAAGYRRVTNLKTGTFSYIPIEGGNFQKLTQVLADVKRPPVSTPNGFGGSTADKVGTGTLRVGSAVLSPIEAAIQESAELAAKSRYSAVAKTGASIAKVMGSTAFNAAMFAILPTTAADGTISGMIEQTYNGMIRAIISSNMRSKDPLTGQELTAEQWQAKLKDMVKLHPSFFQNGEGAAMKMIANLPSSEFVDFKSRVRMYNIQQKTANVSPAEIAAAERQSMEGYTAFTAVGPGGVTMRTAPDFAANRERRARIEAFRTQEESFAGMTGMSQAPIVIDTSSKTSNEIVNNNAIIDIDPVIDDHFDRQYIGIKGHGMYGF